MWIHTFVYMSIHAYNTKLYNYTQAQLQKHTFKSYITLHNLYVAPAWWGLTTEADRIRIEWVLQRTRKTDYLPEEYGSASEKLVAPKCHCCEWLATA